MDTSSKAMNDAIEKIKRDLEEALYFGACPTHEQGLRRLLRRFGVKNTYNDWYGSTLAIESIDAVIKTVEFNMDNFNKWPATK